MTDTEKPCVYIHIHYTYHIHTFVYIVSDDQKALGVLLIIWPPYPWTKPLGAL